VSGFGSEDILKVVGDLSQIFISPEINLKKGDFE
jgi:hypothetical protein